MNKKKRFSLLLVLMMLISFTLPSIPVLATTTSPIIVQMFNTNRAAETNTISPTFKIKNTSASPLNLSDVKVRYFYTSDGDQEQKFWCDHAGALLGYNYVDNTNKVTAQFRKATVSTSNADTYVEIGFAQDASTLGVGEEITVQTRIAKVDWTNYNQSNDYSFDGVSTTLADSTKIVAYMCGVVVFGEENLIGPVVCSTISPTTAVFEKTTTLQADVKTTMTLSGNGFKAITNGTNTLVKGTDYTVVDNVVTISKDYLAKQPTGITSLSINFSAGAPQVLTITVKEPKPDVTLTTTVGEATGQVGDTVAVPVTLTKVPSTGVGAVELRLNFDATLLAVSSITAGDIVLNSAVNFSSSVKGSTIILLFLDDTLGTQLISKDGVFATINFKIKSNGTGTNKTSITSFNSQVFADGNLQEIQCKFIPGTVNIPGWYQPLRTIVGTATGKAGDTVSVPLTLEGSIGSFGIATTEYTLAFDSNLLEVTSITPGNIVKNPSVNFYSSILNDRIKLLFLDDTLGSEAIKQNGVFATINFKIKNTATVATKTSITSASPSVISDTNLREMYNFFTAGTINITATNDSIIAEKSAVFNKQIDKQQDVTVSMTLNGNTLSEIKNGTTTLVSGIDYINSDNVVTISKEYLGKQVGVATLEFVFNQGAKATFPITIIEIPKEIVDSTISPTEVRFSSGLTYQEDISVTMNLNGNSLIAISNGVNPLVAGTDFTVSGNVVTISKNYLSKQADGMGRLSFSFSSGANAILNINFSGWYQPLRTIVGTATGKAGDTVSVPLTLEGSISSFGIIATEYTLAFDSNLLEVTSITPGNIVKNPTVNFQSSILNGRIKLLFLDYTLGSELIKQNGVFATINFKIKNTVTVATKTPITLASPSVIADINLSEMQNYFTAGTINITTTNDSIINEKSAVFSKLIYSQQDVRVSMTLNGNTLSEIKNGVTTLVAGTDYIVSDNVVRISKEYLDKQIGVATLEFVFSQGAKAIFPIIIAEVPDKIIDPTISPTEVNFSRETDLQEDISVTMNVSGNSLSTIKNGTNALVVGTDYVVTGNVVKISKSYLSNQVLGALKLTFSFSNGKDAILNIYLIIPAPRFVISLGTATGKTGDIVSIPVNYINVSACKNIAACEYKLSFDSTVLEVASVTAGDIILNPSTNFSFSISGNTISLLFLDNTLGSELISKDGNFAKINFKIKGTLPLGCSTINVSDSVTIADADLNEISTSLILRKSGSIYPLTI